MKKQTVVIALLAAVVIAAVLFRNSLSYFLGSENSTASPGAGSGSYVPEKTNLENSATQQGGGIGEVFQSFADAVYSALGSLQETFTGLGQDSVQQQAKNAPATIKSQTAEGTMTKIAYDYTQPSKAFQTLVQKTGARPGSYTSGTGKDLVKVNLPNATGKNLALSINAYTRLPFGPYSGETAAATGIRGKTLAQTAVARREETYAGEITTARGTRKVAGSSRLFERLARNLNR
jgi:hypothetical protein